MHGIYAGLLVDNTSKRGWGRGVTLSTKVPTHGPTTARVLYLPMDRFTGIGVQDRDMAQLLPDRWTTLTARERDYLA